MLSAKPWRPEAVGFFIAAQILCLCLGALAGGLLQKAGVAGFKNENDFGFLFLMTFSFQGMTWILMGIFFWVHELSWREGIGWGKGNGLRSFLLALGVVVFILPIAYLLQLGSAALMEKIHWTLKDEEAVTLLTGATSRGTEVYLAIFTVVLVPVAEEFIFRGVLFPFVKQRGFPITAWVGLSLFFALIHGDPAIFIPLFVLSLALTWLYEITDNLLAPIFGHALFNAAGLVFLYLAEAGSRTH
jgi:membrane protease YdiL (CAAX protease family)